MIRSLLQWIVTFKCWHEWQYSMPFSSKTWPKASGPFNQGWRGCVKCDIQQKYNKETGKFEDIPGKWSVKETG